MKKYQSNQEGSSIVIILLVILVLAVIGFGGYFVWNSQQKDTETTVTTSSATSETQYFTIASQNVRLPLTSELADLQPGAVEDSGYSSSDKTITVLAPQLDAGWTCEASADGTKGTIGTISITTQDKRSGPGEPAVTKKVGAYTYGFEPGGANCTSDPAYNELVTAFENQFSALESY